MQGSVSITLSTPVRVDKVNTCQYTNQKHYKLLPPKLTIQLNTLLKHIYLKLNIITYDLSQDFIRIYLEFINSFSSCQMYKIIDNWFISAAIENILVI